LDSVLEPIHESLIHPPSLSITSSINIKSSSNYSKSKLNKHHNQYNNNNNDNNNNNNNNNNINKENNNNDNNNNSDNNNDNNNNSPSNVVPSADLTINHISGMATRTLAWMMVQHQVHGMAMMVNYLIVDLYQVGFHY